MKNDAFSKVNGARRRRRHWSASRPRLSPSPNPSLKPKAEERQSAEEPTGGPAADPKTRTSRTTARPGTSGGGAELPQAQQATTPGRATATTQPPEAQPGPRAERRRWPPGHRPPKTRAEPRVRRRRRRARQAPAAAARAARQRARQARAAAPQTRAEPRGGRRRRPHPTSAPHRSRGPSGEDGAPAGQARRRRHRGRPGGVEPGGEQIHPGAGQIR